MSKPDTTDLWAFIKRQPIGCIALTVSILVLGISASNYWRINREITHWCAERGTSNPAAEAYCRDKTP